MSQIPEHLEDVGQGWSELLTELHVKLLEVDPDYTVLQCKEKFGGLRCYIESESEEAWKIETDYENKSFLICEVCGESGTTGQWGGYWYKTLCEKHRKSAADGRKVWQKELAVPQ
jgi:hypothetical protein